MEHRDIEQLTSAFEDHAQRNAEGVEFWLARDLQHLLGYAEWRNFREAIGKAMTACEVSGHAVTDHFVDVTKMVQLGSGSERRCYSPPLEGCPEGAGWWPAQPAGVAA